MKWVKSIAAAVLALWVVFVTTSTTITAHTCSMRGTTELAVNGVVECEHQHAKSHKQEASEHKCKHACHHHDTAEDGPHDKGVKSNCCSETVFTFYVPTETQEQELSTTLDVSVIASNNMPVVDVVASHSRDLPFIEFIPPPLIPRGTKAFLTRVESYLI